jgi:hypothetical protein
VNWDIHGYERSVGRRLTREERYRILPPDLTPDGATWCREFSALGWLCTRAPSHTGRHAAGTGDHIIAVWL